MRTTALAAARRSQPDPGPIQSTSSRKVVDLNETDDFVSKVVGLIQIDNSYQESSVTMRSTTQWRTAEVVVLNEIDRF